MGIASRIHDTIEDWQAEWKDRLRGWMASWLGFGIEVFFDILGKAAAPILTPLIDKLEESPELPPELKELFAEIKTPKGQVGAMLAQSAGGALIGGAIGKITDALFMRFAYDINTRIHPLILGPEQLISLWRRGLILPDLLPPLLKKHGLDDDAILQMIQLSDWIPFASIITEWVAKEVYEPEMVERYGLDSEFPTAQLPQYWKAGVNREQALNFWRAHWEHPSWTQITEMLHRGHLTPEQVYDWYRLVEIPPGWRDLLTNISYTPYTRVDARRMWDMGVLDDSALLTAYKDIGYDEDHAANMVLWTKVYVTFPDLIARYRNGWIDKETVLSEIVALGMKKDRAEWLFSTKFKKVGAERTAAERDLTATDIIMGVKKGVIAWAEGIELLMDLGYDEEEADFKLAVRIETEGGSPESFAEFKRLTQLYRVSQALPTKMTAEQIKAAEKELAEKYPIKVHLTEEELKVKVDTIRRKRRNRQLTRDEEIARLLELDLKVELATAYADNDDLRLHPEKESK